MDEIKNDKILNYILGTLLSSFIILDRIFYLWNNAKTDEKTYIKVKSQNTVLCNFTQTVERCNIKPTNKNWNNRIRKK